MERPGYTRGTPRRAFPTALLRCGFKTVKELMQHEKSDGRRFFVKGVLVDDAMRNTVARDRDRFGQRVEIGEVDLTKILTKPVW